MFGRNIHDARRARRSFTTSLESLDGRIALSGVGAALTFNGSAHIGSQQAGADVAINYAHQGSTGDLLPAVQVMGGKGGESSLIGLL